MLWRDPGTVLHYAGQFHVLVKFCQLIPVQPGHIIFYYGTHIDYHRVDGSVQSSYMTFSSSFEIVISKEIFILSGKVRMDWLNITIKGYEIQHFNCFNSKLLILSCPQLVLLGRLSIDFSISNCDVFGNTILLIDHGRFCM